MASCIENNHYASLGDLGNSNIVVSDRFEVKKLRKENSFWLWRHLIILFNFNFISMQFLKILG